MVQKLHGVALVDELDMGIQEVETATEGVAVQILSGEGRDGLMYLLQIKDFLNIRQAWLQLTLQSCKKNTDSRLKYPSTIPRKMVSLSYDSFPART